jgi:hypothetical protein
MKMQEVKSVRNYRHFPPVYVAFMLHGATGSKTEPLEIQGISLQQCDMKKVAFWAADLLDCAAVSMCYCGYSSGSVVKNNG